MKRLLCFGDSNTWGYVPSAPTITRFNENERWTGLLQRQLKDSCTVLEFGLCGCESGAKRSNKCYNADAQVLYPSILFACLPVDMVCIMLGTNDLKTMNNWQSGDTAKNLDTLITVTHTLAPQAQILLAPAVLLRDGIENDAEFDVSAIPRSRLCAQEIIALAHKRQTLLFDTNQFVHELGADGCHFTAAAHKAFADGLAQYLHTVW